VSGAPSDLNEEKSNAPTFARTDSRVGEAAIPLITNRDAMRQKAQQIALLLDEAEKGKPKIQISESEKRLKRDLMHPDRMFFGPARDVEMPADQEITVSKWAFKGDSREVSLIRTVQRDLICQVFDQATGKSSRRYIGQRGAYSKEAAEEFIQNRVPKTVNTRKGPINSAVLLGTEEIPIHTWHTDLYEIRLVHRENTDKMEWIVFFIKENRSERVPAGNGKDLRAYIPFWKSSVPQIELGAEGTVSVLFSNIKVSELVIELPVKQQEPKPGKTLGSVLSEKPRSLQLKDMYFDNISARTTTIDGRRITLGYYQGDKFFSAWSYAPLKDGSVPHISGSDISSSLLAEVWVPKPEIAPTEFFTPFRPQGTKVDGMITYQSSKDRMGRQYIVVPANDGGVPVRHPTDPLCGNWISKQIAVKIIYDSNRCRWPGCDKIDYSEHGFVPQDGAKIWWPIKNGPYDPSFDRLKDPCYPLYQQIDVKSEDLWKDAHKIAAVALGAIAFYYGGGEILLQNASKGGAEIFLQNAINGGEGIKLAHAVFTPFISRENRQNAEAHSKHQRGRTTQKEVIEALEQQDIYDRGEEIVKAVSQGNLKRVQELMANFPIIPSEVRDIAIVLAAKHGHLQILWQLLDNVNIRETILVAADKEAKENDHGSIVLALRKYRNREVRGPR